MLNQRHINYDESEKFRAEWFRMLALIFGSPIGAIVMGVISGVVKFDIWLFPKLAIASICVGVAYVCFSKSYNIMLNRDERRSCINE